MACSSLYQSLMVSPGVVGTPPIGLNVRSTSLSLKVTFVRGLLLENGYMIEQFVIGQLVVLTLARWLQQPAWHAGVVHASPSVSVHDEPSATLVCEQVPAALPPPAVRSCRLPVGASRLSVRPLPPPPPAPLLAGWWQPRAVQVSVVQATPSSQAPLLGECWQPWAVQVSVVQATPSSQAPLLGECWQPLAASPAVVVAAPSSSPPPLVAGWQQSTTSPRVVVEGTPPSSAPSVGGGR